MAALAGVAHAQTPLPEVRVSAANIPDYEFDEARNGVFCATCNFGNGNSRFAFTDVTGRTWIGGIDFNNGNFYPSDGRGVLLDSNSALTTDFGNGPEWMNFGNESQVVFTRYLAGQPKGPGTAELAWSRMVNGSWSTVSVPDSVGRAAPAGSLDSDGTVPRINYRSATDNSRFFWRSMDQPAVEVSLQTARTDGAARRWVPGTRKLIYQAQPDNSPSLLVDQIFLFDTDAGQREQLTFDPVAKVGAVMWRAPEFNNEYVFLTMSEQRTRVLIYRQLIGVDGSRRWTVVKTITGPTSLPYFWSPEAFTHNGRSYVFFQVGAFKSFADRTKPNQLAISGIDPLRVDFRMLTNDSQTPRLRLDPEYFITAQGPYIYYNRAVPQTDTNPAVNEGVWRVDTKLGPRRQ
jgi:hypothetical protein